MNTVRTRTVRTRTVRTNEPYVIDSKMVGRATIDDIVCPRLAILSKPDRSTYTVTVMINGHAEFHKTFRKLDQARAAFARFTG